MPFVIVTRCDDILVICTMVNILSRSLIKHDCSAVGKINKVECYLVKTVKYWFRWKFHNEKNAREFKRMFAIHVLLLSSNEWVSYNFIFRLYNDMVWFSQTGKCFTEEIIDVRGRVPLSTHLHWNHVCDSRSYIMRLFREIFVYNNIITRLAIVVLTWSLETCTRWINNTRTSTILSCISQPQVFDFLWRVLDNILTTQKSW